MDPVTLASLIHDSREIFQMRGGTKQALPEEQVTIDFAFATVVAIRDIAPGDTFTTDNLWVKRPGTGDIPAENYNVCLGQTAKRPIAAGEHLRKSDLDR